MRTLLLHLSIDIEVQEKYNFFKDHNQQSRSIHGIMQNMNLYYSLNADLWAQHVCG